MWMMSWVPQSQSGADVVMWFSTMFAHENHLQALKNSGVQATPLTASESLGLGPHIRIS